MNPRKPRKPRKPETIVRHFVRASQWFCPSERALALEFIRELRRSLKNKEAERG